MANVILRNVSKSYDSHQALRGINLEIHDREFVVCVGPSGCGKSTLLRAIAGLIEVSEGEVFIDDKLVNEVAPADRGIAMVFQNYALFPHMSVFDNVGFGLKMAGLPRTEIATRVGEAARMLQIENLLQRRPRELSGGQRQRVAIGRAIVRQPKVFLFDEPLSNLDAGLRASTRVEIARLHRAVNATVIYVTHDQVEAMTLASRIVVMRDGHVEQIGTPLELYHNPCNLFVASFIGTPRINLLGATIVGLERDKAIVLLGETERLAAPCLTDGLTIGDAVTIAVRPQHLIIGSSAPVFKAVVAAVERLGDETFIYADHAGAEQVVIKIDGEGSATVGETVPVGIVTGTCHLFTGAGLAIRRITSPADQERISAIVHGFKG